jgi:hypothetical protein
MKPMYRVLSILVLGVALASCSKTSSTTENASSSTASVETAPLARGEAAAIQAAFSVEAVNVEKRLITLKGPEGNVAEYEVGEQVQRLGEIKPGDTINAEYKVGAVAELREPTAEERSAPALEVVTGERGAPEEAPAGGIARAVRVVTTIEALDPASQSLTVKGPGGNSVTVHVEDATVFSQLAVGQSIVVTFAESLALAVEPGAK